MSKLQELIDKLCPHGVDYKELGEAANVVRGERITKKQLIKDGEYVAWSGGREPFGRYSTYNREANTITIAQYGSAGYVNWVSEKFWANDVCYSVFPEQGLNNRFLYHVLSGQQNNIYGLTTKAIPDCLPKDKLEGVKIPLPPMPVQEEIVRILDLFTELTKELTKELELRRKQYAYYRDHLLSPEHLQEKSAGKEILMLPLDEVFVIKNGYTPSKANKDFWEGGTIPWFRMEDIRANGRVLSDSIQHVTPLGVKNKLFPANSIILATTATIGEHALIIVDSLANQRFSFFTKRELLDFELDMKYVFYYFFIIDEWCKHNTKVSSFPAVDMKKLRKFEIPIPPIEVQREIAATLDKFDALVNSLTAGIPAEINARNKQYEYYRDKLLTFEKLQV